MALVIITGLKIALGRVKYGKLPGGERGGLNISEYFYLDISRSYRYFLIQCMPIKYHLSKFNAMGNCPYRFYQIAFIVKFQCWENIVGGEMYKLIWMDFAVTFAVTLFFEFPRG